MADTAWRRELLPRGRLRSLSRRSDARGLAQLAGHLAALAVTGTLLNASLGGPWMAPAAVVHGVVLIFLFAPLHETIHRTAFESRRLNAAVAWVCGAVLVLPPLYFRYFHFCHHRWTQDPARDPELATPKPESAGQYLLLVSGLPYWRERLATTLGHVMGRVPPGGFLPPSAAPRIVAEARRLWATYALVAGVAVAAESWAPVIYWMVPALLGQPALRSFLLAEHTGCPLVPDMLRNSRTTISNQLVRRLTWNMPYHIEHHAFPSAPFHALPALHRDLRDRLGMVAPGYISVQREILRALRPSHLVFVLAGVLTLMPAPDGAAEARSLTVEGVTFSDENGGFTLVDAYGSGTLEDPFVVVETIRGPASAVLVIRGFSAAYGNRIGTYHPTGFALRKVITNATRFTWNFLDFELQQVLGMSSDTLDGLSFGQGADTGRPFSSDRFDNVTEIDEPLDYISFQDGALRPGETATFNIVITDTTPITLFYLVQRPNRPIALNATVNEALNKETP